MPSHPFSIHAQSRRLTSWCRSRTAAMLMWRNSLDVMRRTTRKFYIHEILWSLVPAEDPDQAFASLCDQGMLIEEIQIPLEAGDAADSKVTWPRRTESISRSLSSPPIRIVVISDTHSQHQGMKMVWVGLQFMLWFLTIITLLLPFVPP
jgi:hypothetical protein